MLGVPSLYKIVNICPISQSDWKRTDPSIISYKMHPKDHMSTPKSYFSHPKSTYGALYQSVYIYLDNF